MSFAFKTTIALVLLVCFAFATDYRGFGVYSLRAGDTVTLAGSTNLPTYTYWYVDSSHSNGVYRVSLAVSTGSRQVCNAYDSSCIYSDQLTSQNLVLENITGIRVIAYSNSSGDAVMFTPAPSIQVQTSALPQLVTSVSPVLEANFHGQIASFNVTVTNIGGGAAQASTLLLSEVYHYPDYQINSTRAVSPLGPGQSQVFIVTSFCGTIVTLYARDNNTNSPAVGQIDCDMWNDTNRIVSRMVLDHANSAYGMPVQVMANLTNEGWSLATIYILKISVEYNLSGTVHQDNYSNPIGNLVLAPGASILLPIPTNQNGGDYSPSLFFCSNNTGSRVRFSSAIMRGTYDSFVEENDSVFLNCLGNTSGSNLSDLIPSFEPLHALFVDGIPTNMTLKISNAGNGDSPMSTARFYSMEWDPWRSGGAVNVYQGTHLGSFNIPPIQAGHSINVSIPYTCNFNASSYHYHPYGMDGFVSTFINDFMPVADYPQEVGESNKSNNVIFGYPPGSLSGNCFSADSVNLSKYLIFNFTSHNISVGVGQSGSLSLNITNPTNEVYQITRSGMHIALVSGVNYSDSLEPVYIPAHNSALVTISPSFLTCARRGVYNVTVTADTGHDYDGTRWYFDGYLPHVSDTAFVNCIGPAPDLTASFDRNQYVVYTGFYSNNASLDIYLRNSNLGPGPADASHSLVAWNDSRNMSSTYPSRRYPLVFSIPHLDSRGSNTARMTFNLACPSAKYFAINATADYLGEVSESNENNNFARASIVCKPWHCQYYGGLPGCS